jgi:hypothetical protein
MRSNFVRRLFCTVIVVLVSASLIALPGCGGSQSNKVSMPAKTYEPPPPEAHQGFGGSAGPKRSLK